MINSRDINDLKPEVAALCRQFIALCAKNGIDVIITSTYRDYASQDALYAQGRSKPGNIVTNAKAGYSFHNFRCAFDFCPIVNGKAQWNDIITFKRCGELGKSLGLEWAGDWLKFKEYAHLQQTHGLNLAGLREAQERKAA
jgi:peptidoglycan L-alanyl-D-glutamate endopeptidase CwlK